MYFVVKIQTGEKKDTKRRMSCHTVSEGKIQVKLYLYLQCKQTLEMKFKKHP